MVRRKLAGVVIVMSLGLVLGVCADNEVTIHDTAGGTGTVSITTKNQDDSDATWTLWGDVNYSKANGQGGNTEYTFSTDENCMFATFTPANGYVNALVDAEAVIYKYNTTTYEQTNLVQGYYFGNSQILNAPYPESRGEHPDVGSGFWSIGEAFCIRYKVRGGYWPAHPNPFVAVQGAWTGDL